MNNLAVKWEEREKNINNPIRNTNQDYLYFINSREFMRESLHFIEYGYYTNAPIGTKDYDDYWDEQERRCLEGYSVGGCRITGRHYFMLNFGVMKAIPINPKTMMPEGNRKVLTFPRFLDHQYYLFNEFEQAFAEGNYKSNAKQGMIIAKSRRKGITYVSGLGINAYNFTFLENSNSVLGAFDKSHYKVLVDGIHDTRNFLNKFTDFGKACNVIDKRDHFRASRKQTDEFGVESEVGFKSEIRAVSFKDNAFKSIGDSVDFMSFEEAGKFDNLLTSYQIAEPTWRDGNYMIGCPIIWGTGGDMEGGTQDFASMFNNPEAYGLRAYNNIYEESHVAGKCGFFIDDLWYYPDKVKIKYFIKGKEEYIEKDTVDENGNSHRELARISLMEKRALRIKGSPLAYQKFITQQPLTPSEAFLKLEGSPFPIMDLKEQLSELVTNPLYNQITRIGNLVYDAKNGGIKFVQDDGKNYIHEYPHKELLDGQVCIWELPVCVNNEILHGQYIVGCDPIDYGRDEAVSGAENQSLGSALVMNTFSKRIVAEYSGKPRDANQFYETVLRLLKFYNAKLAVETNIKGLLQYFKTKNVSHYICQAPMILKDTANYNYAKDDLGIRATPQVNSLGRRLVNSFLLEQVEEDENGKVILNLHKVRSIPLLQELINWNISGNFDRVSAMGMLMILYNDQLKNIESNKTQSQKLVCQDKFWGQINKKSYSNRNDIINRFLQDKR